MSEAIIKPKSIREVIGSDRVKDQIARVLPSHLTPERVVRVMLTTITRVPKLAECSQESVLRCLMDCSALGIEPDGRRAHLIPYGKECQLIVDYKGLIELVRRSGEVSSIRAELVCENDKFAWRDGNVSHEVDWLNPRGEARAAYAVAVLKSGEVQSAVMTRDEIEAIRKRSKAGGSGPWVSDWGEMAKKTCVRRLCKMLPLSYEVADALDRDDDRLEERNVSPRRTPAVSLALPEPVIEQEPEPEEVPVAE